jgi:hypothetical protein
MKNIISPILLSEISPIVKIIKVIKKKGKKEREISSKKLFLREMKDLHEILSKDET